MSGVREQITFPIDPSSGPVRIDAWVLAYSNPVTGGDRVNLSSRVRSAGVWTAEQTVLTPLLANITWTLFTFYIPEVNNFVLELIAGTLRDGPTIDQLVVPVVYLEWETIPPVTWRVDRVQSFISGATHVQSFQPANRMQAFAPGANRVQELVPGVDRCQFFLPGVDRMQQPS